jgi:hypothetical protein
MLLPLGVSILRAICVLILDAEVLTTPVDSSSSASTSSSTSSSSSSSNALFSQWTKCLVVRAYPLWLVSGVLM